MDDSGWMTVARWMTIPGRPVWTQGSCETSSRWQTRGRRRTPRPRGSYRTRDSADTTTTDPGNSTDPGNPADPDLWVMFVVTDPGETGEEGEEDTANLEEDKVNRNQRTGAERTKYTEDKS